MKVLLLLACLCTVVAGMLRHFSHPPAPAPAAQPVPVPTAPKLLYQPHGTSYTRRDGR